MAEIHLHLGAWNSTGVYDSGNAVSGGTKWAAMNTVGGNYLYASPITAEMVWTCGYDSDLIPGYVVLITSLDGILRSRKLSSHDRFVAFRCYNGTLTATAQQASPQVLDYQTFTNLVWPTGGPGDWTRARVNACQFGFAGSSNSSSSGQENYVAYVNIHYNPHAEGTYCFPDGVGGLLLPLVGTGLLLSQMPQVRAAVNERAVLTGAPHRMTVEDDEPAWQDLRSYGFPVHFDIRPALGLIGG